MDLFAVDETARVPSIIDNGGLNAKLAIKPFGVNSHLLPLFPRFAFWQEQLLSIDIYECFAIHRNSL
jgi:hypothetical protein